MDVFVARQPIFDRRQQVVAYELLYRARDSRVAEISDPDLATTEVFINTFMDIGLDRVTGQRRAYINLTRPFLLGQYPLPFHQDSVTLEVLEDIVPDTELIEALRGLSQQGFEIALDDFTFRPELVPLLRIADVVKLDIRQLDAEALQQHVALLRRFGVRLLAEKVETRAEFARCLELGFDLFQGYFFCAPAVLRGKQAVPSRLATLRLLHKLNVPEFRFDELAQTISTDATLAYKLLRYINSAYFGLRRKVESIRHALVLLGQKNIRIWLNLIALSHLQDKSHELMVTTLARARMCELIAISRGQEQDKDKYFLVGLFSALDAFVDMPMAEIIESISLADDIVEGITRRSGPLGTVLEMVLHTERGEWASMNPLGLSAAQINSAYLQSIAWAGEMMQLLGD
ncbi:EAL and HDOD domain-containing protein [Sulfurivermis fontis]|uniref:EAL and HDOD domain-containing protein n=1 Tax=Sulfurivermis fontis TaxID=1972068 RepID=UPI000FD7F7BA|nr:HDOD domain-containing protein [Sulfurivermis fontis]